MAWIMYIMCAIGKVMHDLWVVWGWISRNIELSLLFEVGSSVGILMPKLYYNFIFFPQCFVLQCHELGLLLCFVGLMDNFSVYKWLNLILFFLWVSCTIKVNVTIGVSWQLLEHVSIKIYLALLMMIKLLKLLDFIFNNSVWADF